MRHEDISPELNALTERIIGCAIEVHRALGAGMLERIYEQALEHELGLNGLRVCRQVPVVVRYKGLELSGQVIDLVVEDQVVLELKAVERVPDLYLAQLVSYLHAGDYPIGLLINFHTPLLRSGIYRRLNSRYLPQPTRISSDASGSRSAPPRSNP